MAHTLVWHDPLWLLLLPLALLPWLGRVAGAWTVPHLAWLPRDGLGRWVERASRALACGALAFTVLGLAGPEHPESEITRTGRGAEIALLLDRSSSMDEVPRHNGAAGKGAPPSREPKSQSMREALAQFIARRPDDRYALILFASSALRVLPFTEDVDAVRAGLHAASIGRGLTETDIGRAVLAGIEAFEGRAYTGSRAIMLFSDGGSLLDVPTQQRIRAGLARHRISLYFIYIRSASNSPDLEQTSVGPIEASTPEWLLHDFFRTLKTPYRAFQTQDPASIQAAVAEIDKQQNLPLTYLERVPRIDRRGLAFALAALCALGSLALLHWRLAPTAAARQPAESAP